MVKCIRKPAEPEPSLVFPHCPSGLSGGHGDAGPKGVDLDLIQLHYNATLYSSVKCTVSGRTLDFSLDSTQEVEQHLLGTSVLVFLLLPLVLSCKSTKTKEEISEEYKNIIHKQLEHINLRIQRQVGSCGERKRVLQHLLPLRRISTVSCDRLPRNISDQLQPELQNLRRDINASLGCPCSVNQHAVKWVDSQPLQKKFCRLKRLLATIQSAYEQHNSAESK